MSNKNLSDFNEFKRKSYLAHGVKYNYTEYDWDNRRVYIDIDGIIYNQIIYEHVKGSLPKDYKKYLTFLELKKACKKHHGDRFQLSDFIDYDKFVTVYDSVHDKTYRQKPAQIMKGALPKASIKKYTESVFVEECSKVHKNQFSYINYTSIHKPVEIIHKETGKHYTMIAYNHLTGSVPKELSYSNRSKSEDIILKELLNILPDVNYITSYRPKWLNRKELDIYLPDYKIAIEFNGTTYHHSSKEVPRDILIKYSVDENYHTDKSRTCLENGVKLIHIFDFQLKSLDLKSTLDSYINNSISIRENTFIYVNYRTLETSSIKENDDFLKVYYPFIEFNQQA